MTDRIRLNEGNRKWWTLAAMCFALFMIMLDNTVVNVALPSIQEDLGASLSSLEWTVNAYTLTFAVLLVTGGRLGDAVRREGAARGDPPPHDRLAGHRDHLARPHRARARPHRGQQLGLGLSRDRVAARDRRGRARGLRAHRAARAGADGRLLAVPLGHLP